MLNCPSCGADTTVIETRPIRTKRSLRRRRRCLNPQCEHKFTTYEAEVTMPTQTKHTLPELARILIREYLLTKQFFDQVQTDEEFFNLPNNALADYRIAEEAFLKSAGLLPNQTTFYFDYFGTPFALLTDTDCEEVTVHQLTKLEVCDGSRST